jgi:hypothetical protein
VVATAPRRRPGPISRLVRHHDEHDRGCFGGLDDRLQVLAERDARRNPVRRAGTIRRPAHPPWPVRPDPLPAGLLAGLQHDALAERATLAPVDRAVDYRQLADIVGATGSRQNLDPLAQAEVRRWSRDADDPARDGVPARAFPAHADRQAGRLPQREFDLGRGLGLLDADGPPPRCCSRPVMAALTGFALVRRCIGCWRTLRASGCSRVCTRSRWRPPRSAP